MDIPSRLARRTEELIDSGDYESVSAFARAAFENQIFLHDSDDEAALIDAAEADASLDQESAQEVGGKGWRRGLSLSKIDADRFETAETRPTIKGPIWGQFNKLLPIKIGVRGLAILQSEGGGPVPLNRFRKVVGGQAAQVRTHLEKLDDEQGRRRGEKMAAGLPDGSREKSLRRYRNHFLGSLKSDGDMRGALAQMGFVRLYVEGDEELATLTESGFEFATSPNPVLDGEEEPTETLSLDEREFLIRHLEENLPKEIDGMKKILNWINQGDDTPNKLNEKVATLNRGWSEKVARTMRTGFLGRMYDLGLIGREWEGISVRYVQNNALLTEAT